MRFAVSGSSGLIGSALIASLLEDGHEVVSLVRRGPGTSLDDHAGKVTWDPPTGALDLGALEGCGIFVNLAGAPIGDRRWNRRRKEEITRSRLESTDLLAKAAASVAPGDGVLINGSAVGWYGDRGDEMLDEDSSHGTGFLADLCVKWEDATAPAQLAGVRVAHLRTGVVLTSRGGALKKQLPLFRSGLGGRLGTGRQWLSWISLEDEVGVIRHIASDPELSGPVNAVSPEPATNAAFTKTLGRVLRRPTLASVPTPALQIALGTELTREVITASQRVLPKKLLASGYSFASPDLAQSLRATIENRQ